MDPHSLPGFTAVVTFIMTIALLLVDNAPVRGIYFVLLIMALLLACVAVRAALT